MIDINLILDAINGDEEAFETIIKAESDKLYKTAILYVRNKEDALDVIQETVYKAFVSINQLNNPEYFSTWLIRILIHSSYQLLNKKNKTVLSGDALIHKILETNHQNVEMEIDLPYALSTLDNSYQTAIILFYYHDLSIKSIAEAMEKPEGTIKTYLRRAKIELKKVIEGAKNYEQRMV